MITGVPVVFDKEGFWTHPDLPEFDEGEGSKYYDWLKQNNLRVGVIYMEMQDGAEFDAYMDAEGAAPLNWEPKPPPGDGWFLLCSFDTEDGPIAWFAKPKDTE